MIDFQELRQTFMLTLAVIMGGAALGAGCVILYWLWQKGTPIRDHIERYELPHFSMGDYISRVKSASCHGLLYIRDLLLVIPLYILSFFLKRWDRISENRKWLTIFALVFTVLFGLVYLVQEVPISKILGIVAAGSLIGVVVSPFVGFYCWRFQKTGSRLALAYSLYAIPWSAFGAYSLTGLLIVLAS